MTPKTKPRRKPAPPPAKIGGRKDPAAAPPPAPEAEARPGGMAGEGGEAAHRDAGPDRRGGMIGEG